MQSLTRILVKLLRALRPHEEVKHIPLPQAFRAGPVKPVETPPPNDDAWDEPPENYGTMEEPDGTFYGIFIPTPFIPRSSIEKHSFRIHAISKEMLVATGANTEFEVFWHWTRVTKVKHSISPDHVLYSLCKVGDEFVLEIASFGQKPQQYYCTTLDLPSDRFTLLDYALSDPQDDKVATQRQHALDHSRAKRGQ